MNRKEARQEVKRLNIKVDRIFKRLIKEVIPEGICKKGCSKCCYQSVEIFTWEAPKIKNYIKVHNIKPDNDKFLLKCFLNLNIICKPIEHFVLCSVLDSNTIIPNTFEIN